MFIVFGAFFFLFVILIFPVTVSLPGFHAFYDFLLFDGIVQHIHNAVGNMLKMAAGIQEGRPLRMAGYL